MDVNKGAFYDALPSILKHISEACFVAFDLELSGIPSRGTGKRKPTLQERYAELKEAAERYQILQVGLTVVEEDKESGKYLLRPYNFNLSPLIYDERNINIDRDFTYSSSAVNFLLKEGYQIDDPFRKGVPYLTRQETDLAWERARMKFDPQAIPDIEIPSSDVQATEFMNRVRTGISKWQKTKKVCSEASTAKMIGMPVEPLLFCLSGTCQCLPTLQRYFQFFYHHRLSNNK